MPTGAGFNLAPVLQEDHVLPDHPTWSGKCAGDPVVYVVGSAPTYLDDLEMARLRYGPGPVIALNYVARLMQADHMVTAHAEILDKVASGMLGRPTVHTYDHGLKGPPGPDVVVWRNLMSAGSSALMATKISVAMGFKRTVLCGCPIAPVGYTPGYPSPNGEDVSKMQTPLTDPRCRPHALDSWRNHWIRAKEAGILDNVTSMSGWTRELLQ